MTSTFCRALTQERPDYEALALELRPDMDIVRNVETEATNCVFGVPGQDAVFGRGDGARLARGRRPPDRLVDKEAPQVGRTHLAYRDGSLPLEEGDGVADVALVGRARERCEAPLDPAVVEESRTQSNLQAPHTGLARGRPPASPSCAEPALERRVAAVEVGA